MPKLIKKERTTLIQVYVKPENEKFLDSECDAQDSSRSLYLDTALDDIRGGRFRVKVVKPLGVVAAARIEKIRKDKDNARRRANRAARK